MAYIGRDISNLSDRVVLDSITTSATATYNLLLNSVAFVPSSAESLTVSLNGVIQKPQGSYTVSGSTIVFDSALTSSDVIDFILAERAITLTTVGSGSVGTSQLADDAVTTAKINDGAITSAKLDSGLGLGKIGQVLSTTKTDTSEISSSTFVDVSGLSVTITPTSSSSKIYINCNITLNHYETNQTVVFRFVRGSTGVGVGASAGSRLQASAATATVGGGDHPQTVSAQFLDTPSTTSSTTYKIQIASESGGQTFVNRNNNNDSDNSDPKHSRYASTITVMEVLA